MPVFEEREHAFEAKFAHDQEIAFEVKARRNGLACLWAAGKMGLTGQAAERYAIEVVGDEVRHSDDAVVARLVGDLRARGINIREEQVRAELLKYARRARREIAGKSTSQP
jgi:hypothetical protein